jgi:D-glycero-D-manno-heptose 1,7-bisphosphate phosphatase
MGRRAVLLDRDGVLVADVGPIARAAALQILPGVPEALSRLHRAGLALAVVTNQTVLARGLLDAAGLHALHAELERQLVALGGPPLERFYVCPHHPRATLPEYRQACECRKPRPGLLLRAARELDLDLEQSFAIGDRPSDVAAGRRAGCRTVLLTTGKHRDPPIESPESCGAELPPDRICADLAEAAEWILGGAR